MGNHMKKKFTTSFDELIKNRYGVPGRSGMQDGLKFEELLANYHGKSRFRRPRDKKTPPSVVLSLSWDDGDVLMQHPEKKRVKEYVVQDSVGDTEFEEYIVRGDALSMQSSVDARAEVIPAEEVSAFQEYQVDVLRPLSEASVPDSRTAPTAAPSEWAISPSRVASSRAQATEDDFITDMKSILTGQKVFDPFSKKTVEKDQLGRPASISSQDGNSNLRAAESGNGQAIFDRIAQSMQYANAYDLGTVELENRFSDFDRIADLEQKAAGEKKPKKPQNPTGQSPPGTTVDSTEFIKDMDAIRSQYLAINTPSETPIGSPATVAEAGTTPTKDTEDAEIENLNLAETAKKAAYALKKQHPSVKFTSGKRTKQDQARVMAPNVVHNRKWIEQTYAHSDVRDVCQKWIDDNPGKTTRDEIEAGLAAVLDRYDDDQLAKFSKHISGMAFDLHPIEAGREDIKKTIRSLAGLDKFLEKEGDLVIWHVQFK